MAGHAVVLRVIARLNVGGPAQQVKILTRDLDPQRFATVLATGNPGRGELEYPGFEDDLPGPIRRIRGLRPEISPVDDARALLALVVTVRRLRPVIVHTHTAKAGLLGRLAVLLAGRPRPALVHTYHGHVLRGYFGRGMTAVLTTLERALGRRTDRLVGVSRQTMDDLQGMGIGTPSQWRHVPLGLELARFRRAADGAVAFRASLGLGETDVLASFVGRLAPIKRVDRILRAVAAVDGLTLAIVGDGEERASLERLTAELGIAERVRFLGFRHDLDVIHHATDIAVLSSDNEGTPVALIEAASAGTAVVATDVGGVAEVLRDAAILVAPDDAAGLAAALRGLGDPQRRATLGAAARATVGSRFDASRLVADIEALYDELLSGGGRSERP